MTRTFQISAFALTCLGGVLLGALVYGSDEQHAADKPRPVVSDSQLKVGAVAASMPRLHVGDGAEDHEDDEELDFEEIVARERELAERRAAAITAAVDREAVDPDWAPAAERRIAEALAAHGAPDVTLVSAACKTTLCIAEVEHPIGDGGVGDVDWLLVSELSHGFFVRQEPTSDTSARTMAYLARDGHPLPRAESSSAERAPHDGDDRELNERELNG